MDGVTSFSTFEVYKKIIPFGADEVIVILSPKETISFFGKVQMRVCAGAIRVFGHIFKPSADFSPFYAPYSSFCQTLLVEETTHKLPSDAIGKAVEKKRGQTKGKQHEKEVAVIVLKPLRTELPEGWFEMPRRFSDYFQSADPFLIPGFHPLMDVPIDCVVPQFYEPLEYKQLAPLLPSPVALDSSKSLFSVLVCGPQNAGKSTFCRYMVNQMLNTYKEVLFLEADIGQSEFTPPGIVALNLVKAPIVGPPFTHVQTPVKSYYMGDSSPMRNPTQYVDAFAALVAHYRSTYAGVPLIINLCGWILGMGKDILVEQLKIAQPDVIANMRNPVEIGRRPSRREDISFFTPEFMQFAFPDKLPSVVDVRMTQQPRGPNVLLKERIGVDMRLAQMLSYFESHSTPINAHVPYSVPWNKLRIVFTEQTVAPSMTFHALNGTVVGLCIDNTKYAARNASSPDAYLYPEFILNHVPLCECVATGIIRCIDPTTRHFFIIVPSSVDPAQLQKVNTIVRGTLQTPIPQSLSLPSIAFREKAMSVPYTAFLEAKKKRRDDPSRVAERMLNEEESAQNRVDENSQRFDEPSQKLDEVPADVYGPDTEIDTNELNKSIEIDDDPPIAKPAKAIITPEGPKPIEDIGLEEEMELLEQEWLKNSPNKPTPEPGPTNTTPKTTSTKTTPKTTSAKTIESKQATKPTPRATTTQPKLATKSASSQQTPTTQPKLTKSSPNSTKVSPNPTKISPTSTKVSPNFTKPSPASTQAAPTTQKPTTLTHPKSKSPTLPHTKTSTTTTEPKISTHPQSTKPKPAIPTKSHTKPNSSESPEPSDTTINTLKRKNDAIEKNRTEPSELSEFTKKRKMGSAEKVQTKKSKTSLQMENESTELENDEISEGETESFGRFVRNPIYQHTDILEELKNQEKAWAAAEEHDTPAYTAHDRADAAGYRNKQFHVDPRNVLARASIQDKRTLRRIAPTGATEIAGARRPKRIPRKLRR